MFTRLELTYNILTPLFLGDANQLGELRPPAVKGILRFWFRAANPGGLKREPDFFGSAADSRGQAPFSIFFFPPEPAGQKVVAKNAPQTRWDHFKSTRFNEKGPKGLPRNGLAYLGYPFPLQDRDRKREDRDPRTCIEPETRLKSTLFFPKSPSADLRRNLLAACWLTGHAGGAGSRSRRGFGALALTEWDIDAPSQEEKENWKQDMDSLPLLHLCQTPGQWLDGFQKVKALFTGGQWFERHEIDPKPPYPHPHLGKHCSVFIGGHKFLQWDECLNHMGLELQRFRQLSQPDYDQVKQQVQGLARLQKAPDRSSFGMPLTFRFRSLKKAYPITFLPDAGERFPSLLFLRPALVGGQLYPFFLRLDGDVPGGETGGARIHKSNAPLAPFNANAMDRFLAQLKGVISHA